jgi:transcriptional regulator with XRE-family HTH domain
MASKTFLLQLRQRLNLPQKEIAALFNTKRNFLSQVECGARDLTSKQMEVLKNLSVDKWRKPGKGEKVLVEPDEQTRARLKGYMDDLRISLHHAKEKLAVLQKNHQADAQAIVWLGIMREAVESTDKPDKRILHWIDAQLAAKQKALRNNGTDKQVMCAARIAGIEAELRMLRGVVSKRRVKLASVEVVDL